MKTIQLCALLCGGPLLLTGCATSSKEPFIGETRTEKIPLRRPVLQPDGKTQWEQTDRSVTVTTIPLGAPTHNSFERVAVDGLLSNPLGVPSDSLACGEGALWVMGRECSKIDPGANRVVGRFPDAAGCDIAVGYGAIWAAKRAGSSHEPELRRIDPETGKITATISGISGWPALGEGSVWVYDRGKVFRIDPKTNRLLATIPTSRGVGIGRMVVGEGSVWVLENQGNRFGHLEGLIFRIDPVGNQVVETIQTGRFCTSLAAAEGAVWVTQRYGAGGSLDLMAQDFQHRGTANQLLRIDPTSHRITCAIHLPDPPLSVAVGGGLVWVRSFLGRLYRIDPRTNEVVEGCLTASRSDERGSLLYTAVVAEGALWLGGFAGHAICRRDFPDCAAGQLVPKPESEKDVSNSKPRVEN